MPDILNQFLSLGLINVSGDDSRLTKLQNAAADLQQMFLGEPRLAIYHALMVYSPNIPSSEACFAEDSSVLQKHWPSYVNVHSDTPREIFRAISLEALSGACGVNAAVRAATTFALRSMEKRPIKQKEGALLEAFYSGVEGQVEADAATRWAVGGGALSNSLRSAAVQAPTVSGADPATLGAELNKVIGVFANHLNGALKSSGLELSEFVRNAAARSDLVWWKESLYSPSLRQGYRAVPSGVAAVFMALDLHDQVTTITPLSVEFFLRETVRCAYPDLPELPWSEVLAQFADGGYTAALAKGVPDVPARDGVKTRIERLRDDLRVGDSTTLKRAKATSKGTAQSVGVSDLAVWTFLGLQALRAAEEKFDGKAV